MKPGDKGARMLKVKRRLARTISQAFLPFFAKKSAEIGPNSFIISDSVELRQIFRNQNNPLAQFKSQNTEEELHVCSFCFRA
jgi:hypothetical protein